VHTVLLLASLLMVTLVSRLALRYQQRVRSWPYRRAIQGTVLAMPLFSLGISGCDLHHLLLSHPCFPTVPFWDDVLGSVLALALLAMALFALLWGGIRLLLMRWMLARTRTGAQVGDPLQELVMACAQHVGVRPPVVRLLSAEYPLACTSGWARPWLFLSIWMQEHLDQRELEAVIMHELAHVARRDTLILWMGRVLRDAFWYLPTSRAAYRQLEQDKELACDDLAVCVTHRPLALASALTKVWLQAAEGTAPPTLELAHHLEGTQQQMVARIERLMAKRAFSTATVSVPSGVSILSALGVVETGMLLLLFAMMACGPMLLLTRWV
jgi:beta-lactamase regulating signal transducer with metallopeptidase domain